MGDRHQKHGRQVRQVVIALAALVMVAAGGGCGNNTNGAKKDTEAQRSAPFALTIKPDGNAANLPISSEIGVDLTGGKITEVSLTKKGSTDKIKGSMREDGTAWIPAVPLDFSAQYAVAVTGKSADGSQTITRNTAFSTMAQPASNAGTALYLNNGETVGVAMPVVLEFDPPVPAEARAAVQKRLFVTTNPPQPGVWSWPSGSQVWYRGPQYWKPGTTISVRSALAGLPMGGGRFGDQDRAATVTVGSKVYLDVDNATKQMKVYTDDKLAKQMPVSLGKPSTPSSSGYMVMMSHLQHTIFDTTAEGPGGYRVEIDWAMRLTWGGEFIHAAPWSVGDQGVNNVSHGCVNLSDSDAKWLYDVSHVGDPVLVRGTEVPLANGNGWTAWNVSWAEHIKGSALPVDKELAKVVSTPESVSAIPRPAPSTAPTASAPTATAPAVATTP